MTKNEGRIRFYIEDSMLSVQGVSKYYTSHLAVDDLSFEIKKGQVVGFLGPNGAGKSTSMKIITGYMSATKGEVRIDGLDISKEPILAKKKIGYLPEKAPLYVDMRVKEYLNYVCHLKLVEKSKIKNYVESVLEQTSLKTVENTLIAHLSKGYKQRVGIAQAIVHQPELIVLDEPSVGLDPKQVIEIRELIKSLAKDRTILISSHILSEIQNICDHILIIHQGKLIENLPMKDLVKKISKGTQLEISYIANTLDEVKIKENVKVPYEVDQKKSLIHIKYEKEIESINDLVADLLVAGLEVKEIRRKDSNLEDIYLQLTGGR